MELECTHTSCVFCRSLEKILVEIVMTLFIFFLSASIYFVLMLVSKAGKRNSWQFLGRTEPSPIYWILSWGLFNTADCNSMGIDQRLIIFCAVLV